MVPDGGGVRALWSPVRARAGLLRRRDLRQLRGDGHPRDRRILSAVGRVRVLHGGSARGAGADRGGLSAVVLSLQPESLARARWVAQRRALTCHRAARTTALVLVN